MGLKIKNSKNIVTDQLVLNLDASDKLSYSGSGSTWTDRTSEGNDSTLINSPSFVSTDGGHFNLSATNDYITTPWGANHNPYSNPISISCWFKMNSLSNFGMILSTGQSRGLLDNNQRLYFGLHSSSYYGWGIRSSQWQPAEITTTVNTNWHNVTIVINSTNAYCYIDAELADTKSVDNTYVLNDELWIGTHNHSSNINANCRIASVLVYEKDLSAAEILQNYNATKRRFGL